MSLSGRRGEPGSATVYAIVFICLLTTLALLALSIAGLFVGHRRAAAAADVVALAGAAAGQDGRSECEAASRIAAANRVELVGCETDRAVVDVAVVLDVHSAFGTVFRVDAEARAGPMGELP